MENKKILVLTPDGVGSTLFQRSACAWGNLTTKWINPHELTNGLIVKNGWLQKDWSLQYSQSLEEISNLLALETNNLIVRFAHYHMLSRKDSAIETEKFYRFLNENFFIVSCHRANILEYAMSWAIRDIKKTLNVYSYKQKQEVHPKNDSFLLDIDFITKKLNHYNAYETWINDNFTVNEKFYYEDLKQIDNIFSKIVGGPVDQFKQKFGLSIADFCMLSNVSESELKSLDKSVINSLVEIRKYFHSLVVSKYMPNSVPLKMNSFMSKINKTKNFNDVLSTYNNWTKQTNQYQELDTNLLNELIKKDPFNNV